MIQIQGQHQGGSPGSGGGIGGLAGSMTAADYDYIKRFLIHPNYFPFSFFPVRDRS
jgi:hypothetical protein